MLHKLTRNEDQAMKTAAVKASLQDCCLRQLNCVAAMHEVNRLVKCNSLLKAAPCLHAAAARTRRPAANQLQSSVKSFRSDHVNTYANGGATYAGGVLHLIDHRLSTVGRCVSAA